MPTPTSRLLAHVLPSNATLYERTMASNVARLTDLDADVIRSLWNPQTCPAEDLPYLAWALSVDIWDPDWPEATKRRVIANSLTDHAHKGTLATIRQYLGYVGSTIDNVIVPPAKVFGVTGMNDTQRAAYVASLPQIRIYPFWNTRTAPMRRAFMTGPAGFSGFYRTDPGHAEASAPNTFMQASAGPILYGRKATVQLPDGEETPAFVDQLALSRGIVEQVVFQFTGSKRLFEGHGFFGSGFMQKSRGATNIVTVQLSDDAPQQFAAPSGSVLQDVRPQRIYQTRTAPRGRAFMGRDFFGATTPHMLTSMAPQEIYDQFALIDPGVTPKLNKGRSFLGRARFGIAPFTAELRVDVPMTRPRWRLGVGRGSFMTGFLKAPNFSPLTDSLASIGQGKALRDTVLVDTEIYHTVTLGNKLKLGSFKLGQQIRRI